MTSSPTHACRRRASTTEPVATTLVSGRATALLVAAVSLVTVACARGTSGSAATAVLASPSAPRFPPTDSVAVHPVADGITHYALRRPSGPLNIHVVTVDLRTQRYEIAAARALDSLIGRERTTDIVRRQVVSGERVPVALNADFFDIPGGGASENNQVIDGALWKAVPVTDSPFDTFRNAHTQFAMGANGRPYMDRFVYTGSLEGSCGRFALDGVNGVPRTADALVLFSAAFRGRAVGDSVRTPAMVAARWSDTTVRPAASRGVVPEKPIAIDSTTTATTRPARMTTQEVLLAGYGRATARADSIARCSSPLTVGHAFRPDRGPLTMIVGGWPRVVDDGRNVGAHADSLEGTFPRFSEGRHPRSVIGFSRDSSTIYLVAVDGRQEASAGMSLAELGDFLASIGVHHALNLDGGGSTALVIDGRIVNRPSDQSGERAVGNVVLVRER